ncbi:MAG: hypothetical protein AB4352_21305 [Hormoscilla sp.]
MVDLTTVSILAIEFGLGALVLKHNHVIDKQTDVLSEIDGKLDREFQRLEVRVNNLLQEFDRDIKEYATISHQMNQSFKEAKRNIEVTLLGVENKNQMVLSKIYGVLEDLKRISFSLLSELDIRRNKEGESNTG